MSTSFFLLAHNDDEYFCSALIQDEIARGQNIVVAYTSHGSVYHASSEARERESRAVLEKLGGSGSAVTILPIGRELGVFDGAVDRNLEKLLAALEKWGEKLDVNRLVTLAWEGGHTDHDATHLLGAALARRWGVEREFYEFPLYHAYGVPAPLFRVAVLVPPVEGKGRGAPLKMKRALFLLLLVRFYKSQWKTFLGLMPGILWRLVLHREQQYRRVPVFRYGVPPHEGALLFETRFKRSFKSFAESVGDFVRFHVDVESP